MKLSTKQSILDTARALFNQYGYNSVSLRDIAKTVGISEGNLTYHFKRKENLMEALLSEEEDTFPDITPQTLKDLDVLFLDMQQAVQRNQYFFLHYTQLAQTSPEICQKQQERCGMVLKKLSLAFQQLQKAGLLRKECFPGEYDNVIDTLYLSILYWVPFMELKKARQEYRRYAWRTLYHLLTEKGREELKGIRSF